MRQINLKICTIFKIWQKSMDLAVDTYRLTSKFPKEEKYGLTSQIRRSAVSIPSNISEGVGRNTDKQFANFLGISSWSSNELFTQLVLSQRLEIVEETDIKPLLKNLIEVQKMTYSLINKIS